ncbi:MAG: hypothetical protein H6622_17180 [Halobacteriovoraceae bacterium]|nr:hypothetical protein [Halobacteriovoraceae bacterium]
MLKSFDESEIRFQKKVAQFNEEFKATVERISSKSKNFNIEFKESKEKFKEKNIAILEDIEKSYKKKHKMKEIADSFAYVFSYGVFGTKNKCTIPSICDESLSRTERFMNFFKEMNAEDEKIQKQRDKEFTEDIKNRIERIKQL